MNETSLYNILKNRAKTFPLQKGKKDKDTQFIIYKRISSQITQDLNKNRVFQKNRFQVDVFDTSYDSMKILVNQLISDLLADSSVLVIENSFDSFETGEEDNPDLYRNTLTVWFDEDV